MLRKTRAFIFASGAASLSLCLLLAAGCNNQSPSGPNTSGPPPGMPSGPGGTGGPMMGRGPGGPGGMGQPVAANATGEEVYQAKCRCHGPDGAGGRTAPKIAGGAGMSDTQLTQIIKNGKGRMPAFGSQLTDDQIAKVVATIKGFK